MVNLVNGGKDVVNAFCAHPQIRAVSFVGSSAIAKHVYRSAADTGKRVQALGGAKNFITILPDAEMDKSIANAAESAYGCSGQRCLAASVVVAVGSAYERVREGILAAAKAVVLGDGSAPGRDHGPGDLGGAPRQGPRVHRQGRGGGGQAPPRRPRRQASRATPTASGSAPPSSTT